MPESVKRRGSSGPTIGAMVGLSCFGSVAMGREDIGVRLPVPPDACQPYGSRVAPVGASQDPTEESHVGPKRIICGLAAAAGVLATADPAMAAANTYCVAKPACDGIASASFQTALNSAKAHPGIDRVELGAGDFSSATPYTYLGTAHNPVNIVGEGASQTRILTSKAGPETTLTLRRGSISDVEVVGPPGAAVGDYAVVLNLTGRGERLKLTGGWISVILGKNSKLLSSSLPGGGLDHQRPAILVEAGQAEVADCTVD